MTTGVRFAVLLGLTLAFRFWLAAVVPVTGDEAYFIGWGLHPDWGFYDHPPMVGWWLSALLQWSSALPWLRLPAIVTPALLALALWWALPRLWPVLQTPEDQMRRYSIALMALLAPANVWNVLVTTDTPLVCFSVLSALAWLRAAQERTGDDLRWYALAGLFLAGAVLSKFFVALLGFAYLIDVLRRRTRRAFTGLLVAYTCCIPALGVLGWWNSANCWPNYMFNFVNRNKGAGASATTPLLYVASLVYLLTPPALWFVARQWRRTPAADFSTANTSTLLTLWLVPLSLFALLSIPKTIGLHWLLSFVPLVLVWLGLRIPTSSLALLRRFFSGFAIIHVLGLIAVLNLPLETWKKTGVYSSIIFAADRQAMTDALAADLANTEKGWLLATDGYSSAATLAYNLRDEVIVFGPGSQYARQDDLRTDFRRLDGRNILIISKTEPDAPSVLPYFRQASIDPIDIRGARFWRVRGEGFNYPAYREGVLRPVKHKYYRLPAWLPQTGCPVCERYFPDEACVK